MSEKKPKLVVAVSSRALFDLEKENEVFEKEGIEAFRRLQDETWNQPAEPGVAFPLVKKLLALNELVGEPIVDVVVVSKNDPLCGMRVMDSCRVHGLKAERGIFTGGGPRTPYLVDVGCDLFLSADQNAARRAIEAGIPSACVGAGAAKNMEESDGVVRFAFDGDSVLFSDESERIYKTEGLQAFRKNEVENSEVPMKPGPLYKLFSKLHELKAEYPVIGQKFRLMLMTARGLEASLRAMHTFRAWGLSVDEAVFAGGATKAPFLKTFKADFFFDDQKKHIDLANEKVASGHVLFGVANEEVPAEQPKVAQLPAADVSDAASQERSALQNVATQTAAPRASMKPR